MKNLYLVVTLILFWGGAAFAQCTINPSIADSAPGAYPPANQLPEIIPNVAYNQTVQGKIYSTIDTSFEGVVSATITIDSVRIDSITALPTGISWSVNPAVLRGGGNGCVEFSGNTSDAAGTYNMQAYGHVWTHVDITTLGIDTPYAYHGNISNFPPFHGYYLTVKSTSSVNDVSAELNAALSVFPNPSNGSFGVKLNSSERVNGEIVVLDITGRRVYSQMVDVIGLYYNTNIDLGNVAKGLYTLQLRTADGYAEKKISIE